MVPLNYRLVGRELLYILNNSGATTIIMGPEYVETIGLIRGELKALKHLITFWDTDGEVFGYEQLIQNQPSTEPWADIAESDLFWIMYTSGTTGLPKGVMITHKNVLTDALDGMHAYCMKKEDALLVPPPRFTMQPEQLSAIVQCMSAPKL